MAIVIKIYSPTGTEYDVTERVDMSDTGSITLSLEEETNKFIADDLSISFDNSDNFFGALWVLPLEPQKKYNESTQLGAWNIKIWKASSLRYEGDLDVASVMFDEKNKTVQSAWVGASKRSEISAINVKAISDTTLYFTNERNKRVLTFYTNENHTTLKPVASIGLRVGDRIKTSHLKLNGNIIDQELEVKILGPSTTPPLTAYQVLVRQGCRKVFSEGIPQTPYWRGLTVGQCVEKCFNEIGVATGNQVITGAGTTLVVDELNTKDKTIADVLTDLATYSGCIWFRDTATGIWFFVDRETAKGPSSKDLSGLLCEETIEATETEWYDNVKVTGRPPYFAPDSEPRAYRYGSGRSRTLEIETDFTSNLTTLQTIAQQIYTRVCKIRKKITAEVIDDGTAYNIWDKVQIGNDYYYVVEVAEPLRGLVFKGTINLTLLSVDGVTPTATGISYDVHDDDDPPYPPTDIELGKGTDSPLSRPSWWAEARSQYPSGVNEYPIKRVRSIIDDDDDPKTPPKVIIERLWFVRWKNEFGDDDDPDGYEITVFDPAKGIEKPLQHHGYKQPKKHTDGYYYYPIYLTTKTGAPEKAIVIRTYNTGRPLSAYSDEVSTADWGNAVEDNDPFAGVTFAVTKTVQGDNSNTYRLDFRDATTGDPIVIPLLEKIKICKSDASATSPDLTRKQPPLDCLDYALDPPRCVNHTFRVVIPHQQGVFPRVWFRPIAATGHKMAWTYDSTGGGDMTASPVYMQVSRVFLGGSSYAIQIVFGYVGETTGKALRVWISTTPAPTGTPEDGSGWSATADNILLFDSNITLSGDNYIANCQTYDGGDVSASLPTSAMIIMAVYDGNTRVSNFSSIYVFQDLASAIPRPYCFSEDFEFDDVNNRLIATWRWSNAFNGYAYALTYHEATNAGVQPIPATPSNNVLTPANYEAASQYQTNRYGKTFALVDFGEVGHKYKTLNAATSLTVYHPVGSETPTTLYATCVLFLFLLDGSGNMVFGVSGARDYYGSDYVTYPEITLTWLISPLGQESIRVEWLDDGTNYYIPIQRSPAAYTTWSNVGIAQGTLQSGYRVYTLTGVSSMYKYRFRLARVATYGTEYADTDHSAWATISSSGGGTT